MQTPFNKDIRVPGTLPESLTGIISFTPHGHCMREVFILTQFTEEVTEAETVTDSRQVDRLRFHSGLSDSKVCALNYRASTS